uniref:solute carrier family 46 member 2-like isoform X2 n=1 Tax=Myxine glutinosa TaxID=7769 RepID=UPI00358E4A59
MTSRRERIKTWGQDVWSWLRVSPVPLVALVALAGAIIEPAFFAMLYKEAANAVTERGYAELSGAGNTCEGHKKPPSIGGQDRAARLVTWAQVALSLTPVLPGLVLSRTLGCKAMMLISMIAMFFGPFSLVILFWLNRPEPEWLLLFPILRALFGGFSLFWGGANTLAAAGQTEEANPTPSAQLRRNSVTRRPHLERLLQSQPDNHSYSSIGQDESNGHFDRPSEPGSGSVDDRLSKRSLPPTITSVKLSRRLMGIEVTLGAFSILGGLISGHLGTPSMVALTSLVIYTVAIIWGAFVLRDPPGGIQFPGSAIDVRMACCHVTRPTLSVVLLVSMSLVFTLSVTGGMHLLRVFVLSAPLCWDNVMLGYGDAFGDSFYVTSFLANLVLSAYLPPEGLIAVGVASYSLGVVGLAFVESTSAFFAVYLTFTCVNLTRGCVHDNRIARKPSQRGSYLGVQQYVHGLSKHISRGSIPAIRCHFDFDPYTSIVRNIVPLHHDHVFNRICNAILKNIYSIYNLL